MKVYIYLDYYVYTEFIEPITKDRKRGLIKFLLCFVYINKNFKQLRIFTEFCWNMKIAAKNEKFEDIKG